MKNNYRCNRNKYNVRYMNTKTPTTVQHTFTVHKLCTVHRLCADVLRYRVLFSIYRLLICCQTLPPLLLSQPHISCGAGPRNSWSATCWIVVNHSELVDNRIFYLVAPHSCVIATRSNCDQFASFGVSCSCPRCCYFKAGKFVTTIIVHNLI